MPVPKLSYHVQAECLDREAGRLLMRLRAGEPLIAAVHVRRQLQTRAQRYFDGAYAWHALHVVVYVGPAATD